MNTKSKVFRKFKEFKAFIESHSERRIKTLITNNGGEYTSKEFEVFCSEYRIEREPTTAYNPQHNGVAERNNITIMKATKTMINDQDLPMHLWAEATRKTLDVHNILSHSALGIKTPE